MEVKLNEKIKNLRKQAGLSQEELAEKLHVSRQTVFKWEAGKSIPDTDNVVLMSKLFGVSLEELLFEEVALSDESKQDTSLVEGMKCEQGEETQQPNEEKVAIQEQVDVFEEFKQKRQRLMGVMIMDFIYTVIACGYYMISHPRIDNWFPFLFPTLLGMTTFLTPLLVLFFTYTKKIKYEIESSWRKLSILTFLGLVCYGVCIFVAGYYFILFPSVFVPRGLFDLLLYLIAYLIQFFVPFILIRRAISALPFKMGQEGETVDSIKRNIIEAVILAGACFLCANVFYRIKAATGAFDSMYSDSAVLWGYLDGILLVSLIMTALFILPCISLIRACGRWKKYNMPLKKGRFRFLYVSTMLYLALVLIGNWMTFEMFYGGNFFSISLGLIINVIVPVLVALKIFIICEKRKKLKK